VSVEILRDVEGPGRVGVTWTRGGGGEWAGRGGAMGAMTRGVCGGSGFIRVS